MLPAHIIQCPYCGETIELLVDDSAGAQRYVEDCQVCCRPIEIVLHEDIAMAWRSTRVAATTHDLRYRMP